jgi:cardiolipin synthase
MVYGWIADLFRVLLVSCGLLTALHALLYKRDPRASLGWIVTSLAIPGVGPLLYWLLGVNRIRARGRGWQEGGNGLPLRGAPLCAWSADLAVSGLPFRDEWYAPYLTLADTVTRRPLLGGNAVKILINGDAAYPAMLEAIHTARQTVYLSSYIFESNATGRRFIEALSQAVKRGVEVRVLVDALGECYSRPLIGRLLSRSMVPVARFLPFSLGGRGMHFNLRNHRKLLVVDGTLGFTGGMNIGDRHLLENSVNGSVRDLHFRIEGPVVGQMQDAFCEDWGFATGEHLAGSMPTLEHYGSAVCRGVSAGPNEDFEKLHWLLTGVLAVARERVCIMTPYFIPDRQLVTALNTAALRGVKVELLLPERNNLPLVQWASRAYFWELLQYGVRIYLQPPPFDHSKLLLVDDLYSLVGSANLDPRSLRLNFEFNLEVYDSSLNARLAAHFDACRNVSHPVTREEMDGRPLPAKMRDATAKLLSPYL